jgi:hypothetical protein
MNAPLPTAQELERLPVRAVVAYAARAARRISSQLRGIVADELLDDALRLSQSLSTTDAIGEVDSASVVAAAERVAGAYANAPATLQSPTRFFMVTSLTHAALATMYAALAADDPGYARHNMKRAAENAERATRPINALSSEDADLAMEAARRDYQVLLRAYGEHEEVVIGEPVVCFDSE